MVWVARGAAPGSQGPRYHTLDQGPGPGKRILGIFGLDFPDFWATGEVSKNLVFFTSLQNAKNPRKPLPCRLFIVCGISFHGFGELFSHRFFNSFLNGENHEFIALCIVLGGFSIPKPFIFRSIFLWFFMVFSEPLPESIFPQKTPVYVKKCDFGSPFEFHKVPKSTLGEPFSRKRVSKSPIL